MRKHFVLSLFFVLLPIVSVAQYGPTRTAQDAEEVFFQDFESDWDEWTSQEIDSITNVSYYNVPWDVTRDDNYLSNVNLWSDSRDWTLYGTRDTLIILKNDVVTTDNPAQVEAFNADTYTIVNDQNDPSRQEQLDKFGTDGGDYYFRWATDVVGASIARSDWGDVHTDGTVARYRRNLFIHGLKVEEQSSYRLTMYVKAKQLGQTTPTLYADVMRGCVGSEKPFSMGVLDDAANYQYNRAFEYTKKDFKDDEWEKVTFMTYYLNDTTAQDFLFKDGYWWTQEWKWRNPNGIADTLCYIMQPDKYFVRLSFASDSTIFSVDNISLTKSWIGGVEYNGDLLRVDFGYETNLKDLAKEAYERTKIAVVELLSEYFEVWGYDKSIDEWFEIEIASAEYHDDGYMYMWTKPLEIEGLDDPIPNLFDDFDSVLVSFTNPVDDPTLCLKYTGKMFPKALDVDWIKDGKKVPDFHNEIGMANPYAGVGVFPIEKLPPVVLRGITAEFGSFQLDGTMSEMTFKVSRLVEFDNEPGTELATMKVAGAGSEEWWTVKEATDTSVTFQRPTGLAPLAGDYEFTLMHLKGEYTEYAEPFTVNYSFGKAEMPGDPDQLNFNDCTADGGFQKGACAVDGFSAKYASTKLTEWSGDYNMALMWGLYGVEAGAQNNEGHCATLNYEFECDKTGNATIEIIFSGCHKGSWNDCTNLLARLYDADGNQLAREEIKNMPSDAPDEGVAPTPSQLHSLSISAPLVAGATYKLSLGLPNEGSYGFGGHKGGHVLYALNFTTGLTLAGPYMSSFAAAQKKLAAQIAKALKDKDNYTGEKYQAALNTQTQYAPFNVDELETAPSVWNAATKALNDATDALAARMAVVDAMWAAFNKSIDLAASYDEKSEADGVDYSDFESYQTLLDNCVEYEDFIAKDATDDEIKEIQAIFEADQKTLDAEKESYDAYMKVFNEARELLEAWYADMSYEEYAALEEVFNEYDENFYAVGASNDERSEAAAEIQAAIDAYNAYVSGYIAFTTALANAEAQLEAEDANPALAAYGALEELYAQYANWDAAAATEEELAAATTALSNAMFNNIYYRALANLAEQVEANLGDNAEEYAERAANADDDAALENLYKTAIKAAIYNKVANGEELEIPVSAFIKNNELWANVKIVERMDKQMPANAGDLSKADEGGANIQHTRHQYIDNGNMPIWVMILKNDYTNLLPGWTARAEQTGNSMVTVSLNEAYQEFKDGKSFWNGELGMDWNSKATLTQTIEDLPVGVYSIGANFLKNTGSGTQFDVTAAESATAKVAQYATGNQGINDVKVEESTEAVKLMLTLTSGSGWSRVDDFYMTFTGAVEGFDYAAAAAEEAAKLEVLIQRYGDGTIPDTPDVPDVEADTDISMYDNVMYVENQEVLSGFQAELKVKLHNETKFTAFSFDLELPNGFVIPKDSNGKYLIALNSNRAANHMFSCNMQDNGLLSVACLSLSNDAISGYDGDILSITVDVPEGMSDGDYPVVMSNIRMATSGNTEYKVGRVKSTISVASYIPGDVNGDGEISIVDAVGVVNIIIHSATAGLQEKAADVNRDGEVSIVDAVCIINEIIHSGANAPLRTTVSAGTPNSRLEVEDKSVEKSGMFELPVVLDGNPDEITGMQFSLRLPSGVSFLGVKSGARHMFAFKEQNDGTVLLAGLSPSNATFTGAGDAAVVLMLDCSPSFTSGELNISEIELATPSTSIIRQQSVSSMLTRSMITPVADIDSTEGTGTSYDLQGRKTDSNSRGITINGGKKIYR